MIKRLVTSALSSAARDPGVPVDPARELATQATGAKSANRLMEFGMAPDLAREVVN